ncbi:MAG TPA: D-aminoacyl-tRNA deacylase [Acidobacteriota bacterium]|nr:D-aminoacyl-tRNA deacylase [Acidobacteriota bacterium]
MKIVLQRVKKAHVEVEGKITGDIKRGFCLLVGIEKGDTERDAVYLADKISGLRVFSDQDGKMNLSIQETGGEILAVSQFTLAGSVKKGRRPSFDSAEKPDKAEKLFQFFVAQLRDKNIPTETGIFGAMMDVYLVNDGPVTFIISS